MAGVAALGIAIMLEAFWCCEAWPGVKGWDDGCREMDWALGAPLTRRRKERWQAFTETGPSWFDEPVHEKCRRAFLRRLLATRPMSSRLAQFRKRVLLADPFYPAALDHIIANL